MYSGELKPVFHNLTCWHRGKSGMIAYFIWKIPGMGYEHACQAVHMQWMQDDQDGWPWLYVPCAESFYLHNKFNLFMICQILGVYKSSVMWNHHVQALLTFLFQFSRAGACLSQDWTFCSCSSGGKSWLNGQILICWSMKFGGSRRRHFHGKWSCHSLTKLTCLSGCKEWNRWDRGVPLPQL